MFRVTDCDVTATTAVSQVKEAPVCSYVNCIVCVCSCDMHIPLNCKDWDRDLACPRQVSGIQLPELCFFSPESKSHLIPPSPEKGLHPLLWPPENKGQP